MATWSSYRAPLNNDPDMDYAIFNSDNYCYWASSSGSITSLIQYDPVADTETLIWDDSNQGTAFFWGYTVFSGGVYMVASEDTTGDPVVLKYDGTPDNWTEVQKLRVGRTAGTYGVIFSNNEYIAAVHVDYQEGVDSIGYHSSNGSDWSESYFETMPIMGDNISAGLHLNKIYKYRPIITSFCTANTGAPGRDCTNTNTMMFSGSGWVNVVTGVSDSSDLPFLISPIYNQIWTYELDGVSGLYTERNTDSFTSPDVPNSQIMPVQTSNYYQQFGVASGTTASEIYIWQSNNKSDWELLDTVSDGISINSSDYPSLMVFELDNYNAYFLFYNLDNIQYEIWKRDIPLPGPQATLYFGLGLLEEKSTLSFKKSPPQGLALRESLGTVVAGSDSPDNTMVEYAEHPYTGPIESDTGIPTGTSVSAIRWI